MTDSTSLRDEEVPKWDIALEGLAKETYQQTARGLTVDDFHKLAVENKIRLDDIMVTMFELCIYGEWQYQLDAKKVEITRETLDNLFVNARLQEKDVRDFTGNWRPIG